MAREHRQNAIQCLNKAHILKYLWKEMFITYIVCLIDKLSKLENLYDKWFRKLTIITKIESVSFEMQTNWHVCLDEVQICVFKADIIVLSLIQLNVYKNFVKPTNKSWYHYLKTFYHHNWFTDSSFIKVNCRYWSCLSLNYLISPNHW